MKRQASVILSVFALLLAINGLGQDIHFSHYQATPLLQNPAFAGAYNGDFQFGSIHRNQWNALGEPFVTTGASFDHKLFVVPYDFGIGITAVNDQSGVLGFNQNRILLSSGIHLPVGRDKIGIGIQSGMTWKTYGLNGITYPGQYNRDIGLFDTTLPSGEASVVDQLSFFDVNIGALYRMQRSWGNMLGGVAVHHLNSPGESFLDRSIQLKPRLVLESRAEIMINEKSFLMPSLYWQQHNKAHEFVPGVGWGMYIASNSMKLEKLFFNAAMRTGINRMGDAVLASGGLAFKQLLCVVTYDYNYSDFSVVTQGNGGIEFALVFTGLSSEVNDVILPCDRY